MIVATLRLIAAAAESHSRATDFPMLWATAFLIGLGCCSAQLMTPYAALLAPPGREGRASSLVLSGILTGVLLSRVVAGFVEQTIGWRSEEHTSELQSLMRISYAVFCLKKKKQTTQSSHAQLV